MYRLAKRLKMALFLLRKGQAPILIREVFRRLYSTEHSFGLRRDLEVPFETPAAKIDLEIRPLVKEDIHELLDDYDDEVDAEAMKERARRKLFLREEVPTCYVAVAEGGHPAYMQWLMGPDQNDAIQSYFSDGFPILKDDEALLEFAFSHERYRGMRVMQHAMAEIAIKGRGLGARFVLTFVGENNIPSLKGCKRAGFFPYLTRIDRWRFFHHSAEFEVLPIDTPYSFDT